ncbi:pseudouridine-5'-phosphate glycosidase [Rhodovibrionaceae bacterium A322]
MTPQADNPYLIISAEVRQALADQQAVVALESTVISHGLPYPQNRETALQLEGIIREQGAVPATIALLDGKIFVGLNDAQIERLAEPESEVAKVSRRDMAAVLTSGDLGATTVAGTMMAAHMAGIELFATGGIGGVHRQGESSLDISADLQELARTPVSVVSSGAKSILDLPRTLEVLETLGVPVVGYETLELPAFFTPSSGLDLAMGVANAGQAASLINAQRGLGLEGGILFTNPVPDEAALEEAQVTAWIEDALASADEDGITGKDVTPYLLSYLHSHSQGATLAANRALLLDNARVAAGIAVALAESRR